MTSVDDINSLESEAGIIASLIHKPDFIFYSEYLLPNHFTNKENRCVYTAIGDLVNRGITTVDPYNIIESLNASEATRKYADELSVEKLNELMEMSDVLARHTPEEYKMLVDNALLARTPHSNPSEIIDELLKDNLGYLIYQEDTIKFLQQICGLSGSEADNIRRAIGRKQKDRLDAAMPSILEGYCEKSPQPRAVAESEAKEFLQIIEDSASYQFGYNHSIAYCLLGYLCAYYRYYHPLEFITSFLNNAANEDDIRNGTAYAHKIGIQVTMPKWGLSKSEYFFDSEKKVIAKGLSSIKYMSSGLAEEMFEMAHRKKYRSFMDLLCDLNTNSSLKTNQLDILIKIDFFSEFGNQRELLKITELFYDMFKKGQAKQIKKERVDGTPLESIVKKYAVGVTKSGGIAKSYTLLDVMSIMHEAEDAVKELHMDDLSIVVKVRNFAEVMGYVGYVSGREEDRKKLYAELNTKSDFCQECGYDGEIQIVENEDGKLIWKCPNCGNTNRTKMNIARRTCGYIGVNDFNQGRTQEIKERYVHLGGE